MHHVSHIDWSFADDPGSPSATSSGMSRIRVVGPEHGAVHTDLAAVALAPGGWLAPHVHAFEEALYVLEGELLLDIGGTVHRLAGADYALMPDGTAACARECRRHADARCSRSTSPQRLRPGCRPARTRSSRPATTSPPWTPPARRPAFGDPTLRLVGHYDGTGPQARDARNQGRRPRTGFSRAWTRPCWSTAGSR